MKSAPPSPRVRPYGKLLCALGAMFAAGVLAATATTSSAAPLVLGTGAEQHTFTRAISVPK
jgi:hypothetical protein